MLAALAGVALAAHAQSPAAQMLPLDELDAATQAARERSGAVFRRLDNVAPAGRPLRTRELPAVNVTPGRAPDPAAIAEQFRRTQVDATARGPVLLIFVSFSIPPENLLRLGEQASRADGVLVFRGLAGTSLREMAARVAPLAKTGAALQIDPDAFARFGVEVVPTFAVAERAASCGEGACAGSVRRVAGDVTLDHALERLAGSDDPLGRAAAAHLRALRGGR